MKTRNVLKITAIVLLFIIFFIILGVGFAAFLITKDVNLTNNDLKAISADLVIYDKDGNEIEYYSKIKSDVAYADISPYIIDSFVALEDKRFYEHHGLDYKRIAGAAINNIKAGYLKEGGSTITQQLAKNAILTNEKTFVRKLKEAKLAIAIEKNYTKDEIITMYLNTIYFGHSLYGVKSACKRLFGKSPSEVSLGEAAMLAGIVKNPLKNSPLNSIENAIKRRDLVLNLLFEQGYINESERDKALNESYTAPQSQKYDSTSISYAEAVIAEAANALNVSIKEIITGGYKIETYHDTHAQAILKKVYNTEALYAPLAERLMLLGDNATGGVIAYISGLGYTPDKLRRQPASTIKPILTYTPAFESGKYFPSSPIEDKKHSFGGYSPQNYQNSYLGWIDVKTAVTSSSNVCAVQITDEIGLEYAMNKASACGLSFDEKDNLASALGGMTYGVTPLEITEAYMTLASNGIHKSLKFISKIIDNDGNIVYFHHPNPTQVFSATSAYLMTNVLTECSKTGTASKLSPLGFQIASKTGTGGNSDGNTDAWNMSYTTQYTLCSWYGAITGSMPTDITGGGYPTLQSRYIHQSLEKPTPFQEPFGIIHADIDSFCADNSHILKLANENTPYEYRRSAIFPNDKLPEISNYFDNSLPSDFEVKLLDNNIIFTLTASDRFDYRLLNVDGTEICKINKNSGYNEYVIPALDIGIKGYYLESRTPDGVYVAESAPQLVFIWF